MSQDYKNVSRRKFLAAGSAAVVGSSLLTGEANAAPENNSISNNISTQNKSARFADVPVTTEAAQTLKNKKISYLDGNVLGTNYINIKESPAFPTSGYDITDALNWAIAQLNGIGGQILIPRGNWQSRGGHLMQKSISIEGVGCDLDGQRGTTIQQISGEGSNIAMFILTNAQWNCSLKNLVMNMVGQLDGIGLLMENPSTIGTPIYQIHVENVCFAGGKYGIKVNSTFDSFECILNKFDRVSFLRCRTGFYCNSVNGGYSFDNCYFVVPTSGSGLPGGTALDIQLMGNLALEHCLFIGTYPSPPQVPPTDGTTILKTTGGFNSISFIDCQDENLEYAYQNANNYYVQVPIVYRNCILQSKLKFTASGSVVFDSCRLNGTLISDTATAFVRVLRQGLTEVLNPSLPNTIGNFVNKGSYVIDEFGNVNPQVIIDVAAPPTVQEINASRGAAVIKAGTSSVTVYNIFVRDNTLISAFLRSYDSGGARISYVQSGLAQFTIHLNQNATSNLSVGFNVNFIS